MQFMLTSVASKSKIVWDRITFSRLTIFYFIFSVLHFVIQVTLQVRAYQINAQAAAFLWDIVQQGNATEKAFFVLGDDLRMCDYVPSTIDASGCQIIWNGGQISDNSIGSPNVTVSTIEYAASTQIPSASFSIVSSPSPTTTTSSAPTSATTASNTSSQNIAHAVTITVVQKPTNSPTAPSLPLNQIQNGNSAGYPRSEHLISRSSLPTVEPGQTGNGSSVVILNGFGWKNTTAVLDESCLWALNFPVDVLDNTKREDIVFILFQVWVLGMSTVALLNESIPHIVASLLTHMLATGWAGFQINHTANFHTTFSNLTNHGACSPINLLPHYWMDRGYAEIPILILNIVALFISAFLTWKLIKLFGWQTFKRVGASLTVNRIYKTVLTLSIAIQLSLFFIAATAGLWIDQLMNGEIGQMATYKVLYETVCISIIIFLVPWLMTGWFAVRRELRTPMVFFLVLCFIYLCGWSFMFWATTFRWTFVQWRFFSLMASASVALTVVVMILAIICRINFGKGLLRYLQAQETLESEVGSNYDYDDYSSEKVHFPSRAATIPTFSVTFGSGSEVPPPSQMKFGPPKSMRGPAKAESQPYANAAANNNRTYGGGLPLGRTETASSSGSESTQQGKRWIIE